MEERVEKIELKVENLKTVQGSILQSIKTIDQSIEKIASYFNEMREMQYKTEIHRQEELVDRIESRDQRDKLNLRIDEMIKTDRDEKNHIYKLFREDKERCIKEKSNQALINQDVKNFMGSQADKSLFWRNVSGGVLIILIASWVTMFISL